MIYADKPGIYLNSKLPGSIDAILVSKLSEPRIIPIMPVGVIGIAQWAVQARPSAQPPSLGAKKLMHVSAEYIKIYSKNISNYIIIHQNIRIYQNKLQHINIAIILNTHDTS